MKWASDGDPVKLQVVAELARKTAALFPDSAGPRLSLGRTLIDLGQWDEATACLRDAVARFPESAELHYVLACILATRDAREEALAEVESALALEPGSRNAHSLRVNLLARLRRWRQPDGDVASSPPEARAQAMLAFSENLLREFPGHTDATYFKALALAQLGRSDEARDCMRVDRIVDICDLPTPPAYNDPAAFRNALMDDIRRNPTVVSNPRGRAFRDAERITRLRQTDTPAVEALIALIKNAVDDFERRQGAAGTALYRARPGVARLAIWATHYGSGGYEKSHYHSNGWLSGVYYVSATRPPGESAYRGRLIVGAVNPNELGSDPPWSTQAVEPVPGRLVLFPSYVPHATEPSGVEGARTSVAFDVVPVHEAGAFL